MSLGVDILSAVLGTGIVSAFLPDIARKLRRLAETLRAPHKDNFPKLIAMEKRLLRIQCHIDDAENKAFISSAYQLVIEDCKNVLLDADDILDDILMDYEWLHAQTERPKKLKKHFTRRDSKLSEQISEMMHKLNQIASEMEVYTISEVSQPQTFAAPPQTMRGSLVDELSVIGREIDKRQILELMDEKIEGAVSVISIVGMVGIGKTTVAQLVFNDPKVVEDFTAARMWWVSAPFNNDVLSSTRSICESAMKTAPDSGSSLDSLQLKLKEIVGVDKKFLLVLDGMDDENPINWDALRLPFRSARPGSIIMVTTRSKVVSSIVADHSNTHCLGVLSDKHCLEIISQGFRSSLSEKSGLQIARKCEGLPLVAKWIGSVIRLKSKNMQWDEILKCELWSLAEDKTLIFPVLKAGYDCLPGYLKRCFSYSSLLPRNRPFKRDDLINLWAAEGFIQAKGRKIEDVGQEYFDHLCSRSFFQTSLQNPGKGEYEMHSFLHDLAKLVSTGLCFAFEDSTPHFPKSANIRHSSICDTQVKSGIFEQFYRYEKLRTVMVLGENPNFIQNVPEEFFKSFPYLRVLNLNGTHISTLSECIKNLRHLHHLDVSGTLIIKFPDGMNQLYGLERLVARNCRNLVYLPENLSRLLNLRHIALQNSSKVAFMPVHFGKLTTLETLTDFIVAKEKGKKIEELKDIRCLRGSLCIQKLENVGDKKEAEAAKLHEKQYLEDLELQWEPNRSGTADQTVLEQLTLEKKSVFHPWKHLYFL